jgi:hypothetical protein
MRNEVTLYGQLVSELQGQIDSTVSKVLSGSISDFTAYREALARVRALNDAIETVTTVFRGVEGDE